MQLFSIRIFGLKDLEDIVFDKPGLLDKSCHHSGALRCQLKMKGHQKELTSAFKQFENVREVREDLFLSMAYLPDELLSNNVLLPFHSG
jgi:hypothetical protein